MSKKTTKRSLQALHLILEIPGPLEATQRQNHHHPTPTTIAYQHSLLKKNAYVSTFGKAIQHTKHLHTISGYRLVSSLLKQQILIINSRTT